VFSALEVFYENALYKFTFDIDIDVVGGDVKHCSNRHALCYSLLLQYTDVPTTEMCSGNPPPHHQSTTMYEHESNPCPTLRCISRSSLTDLCVPVLMRSNALVTPLDHGSRSLARNDLDVHG